MLIFAFVMSLAGTAGMAAGFAFAAERADGGEVLLSETCGFFSEKGVPEEARLFGKKQEGFHRAFRVKVFREGKERLTFDLPYGGYGGNLFTCDFVGDGTDFLYFTAETGGSGGYSVAAVYDLTSDIPRLVFDGDIFLQGDDFTAEYADGYRLKVSGGGEEFFIALRGVRDEAYLSSLYTADGALKEPAEGTVAGLAQALPAFRGSAGRCVLLCYREVWGLYHADSFGYLISELLYEGGEFRVFYRLMGARGVSP